MKEERNEAHEVLVSSLLDCSAGRPGTGCGPAVPGEADTLIAPFPTGASQILAHLVSEKLGESLGKPVVVDYRPGGVGSSNHLASELFASLAKVRMVHVPYKGASIALINILSGESDMVVVTVPATIPFINSGRLRGIAVLDKERAPTLPNVPTSAEGGMPELLLITWYGIAAPTGVRNDIIERLHKDLVAGMQNVEVKQRLAKVGIDSVANTPGEFAEFMRAEVARWARVIKAAKIQFD